MYKILLTLGIFFTSPSYAWVEVIEVCSDSKYDGCNYDQDPDLLIQIYHPDKENENATGPYAHNEPEIYIQPYR